MKLCFPEKILDQHLVVLGKTGAGKSSALRHVVEFLLSKGKRVCVADPKGDWWGVKSSKDGRSAGFPVIAFGDFKEPKASDVPINGQSGKHVAELIASGNRPCLIGFRGWMPGQMTKFWIDFASTLFNTNAGELYLIVDEVHNFAPKGKTLSPESALCLHWTNRMLSEGRGSGLVCLIASQRPQKVHNDTLTCCETLVAMRVNHAADRAAVKDWIDGCGDKAKGLEVLNGLAQLPRGSAWIWSPEIGFGPTLIRFPMFETFDSFAPPQLQRKVSNSGWADVDLGAVKEKLASVIKEAEDNDPKKLKAEIARLQRSLIGEAMAIKLKPTIETKLVDRPVITPGQFEELRGMSSTLLHIQARLEVFMTDAKSSLAKFKSPQSVHAEQRKADVLPENAQRRVFAPTAATAETGNSGARRMMIALAQRPGINRRQIAIRAGLSSSSGSFSTYLSKLRTNAWIEEGNNGAFYLSESGLKALGEYDGLPTGADLRNYWLEELGSSGAARILIVLIENHPSELPRDQVGELAGLSSESGSFSTYLSKLRTLELITGSRLLKASDELFDQA